jgi:hypothetical protein
MVRILQVDYYKTCKTFYSKKKKKEKRKSGGGAGEVGDKIKGKKNGREGQCLTSPLFIFIFENSTIQRGNKITVVASEEGGGLQSTEVSTECPANVLIILGRTIY